MGDECDRLLHELDHLLHGELPADRTAALHAHLEDCPPCFESADFQAQLKALVAKRCGEQVPDGLRERVISFLQDNQPS
jgi:anti-sigma factor (TIGR02949 family)